MPHRQTHRVGAASALLVACLGLGACGGDSDDSGLQPLGESSSSTTSSAAPTTSSSPSSTPSAEGVPDAKSLGDGEVGRGRNLAQGEEQQAVAEAWLAFWDARTEALASADPTAGDLGAHAEGKALSDAVNYVNTTLRPNNLRVLGGIVLSIEKVTIAGTTAEVTSCMNDASFNATAAGEPVEPVVPFHTMTGTLTQRAGNWIVTQAVGVDVTTCEFK